MLPLVRERVAGWRRREGLPTPTRERAVPFDATRGAVDGIVYLLFEDDDPQPTLIAKLARSEVGRRIYDDEFRTLQTLERAGINDAGPSTPRALDRAEIDGTLCTLQTALRGVPMKNVPGPRLFSDARAAATIEQVLGWWEGMQRRVGVTRETLDAENHDRRIVAPIERYLNRFFVDDDERAFLTERYLDGQALAGATLPMMARHADFCTANMMLVGDRLGVYDWEFPLTPQLPLFDAFFFLSSCRYPHGTQQGEVGHLDSFVTVFWGDNPFRSAGAAMLRRLCDTFEIEPALLGDLLVLALIEVAGMKYQSLQEGAGIADVDPRAGRVSDEEKRRRWGRLFHFNKDAPFARIDNGVLRNLGEIVRRGVPSF